MRLLWSYKIKFEQWEGFVSSATLVTGGKGTQTYLGQEGRWQKDYSWAQGIKNASSTQILVRTSSSTNAGTLGLSAQKWCFLPILTSHALS